MSCHGTTPADQAGTLTLEFAIQGCNIVLFILHFRTFSRTFTSPKRARHQTRVNREQTDMSASWNE
jgi:hypothetical protein